MVINIGIGRMAPFVSRASDVRRRGHRIEARRQCESPRGAHIDWLLDSLNASYRVIIILVDSILLRNVYINIKLSDIHQQSQLRVFIDVLFSYFMCCEIGE
jgi:hypothetical protein